MDKFGGYQDCLDLDHFCRLTSIELHLNPHSILEDNLAERAGSWFGQARAPNHIESLHLVSNCHLLLSCHMPLTSCALSKHSEFPRGCELVDHFSGQTAGNRNVTSVGNVQTHAFTHVCTTAVTHPTPFLHCEDKQVKKKMLQTKLSVLAKVTRRHPGASESGRNSTDQPGSWIFGYKSVFCHLFLLWLT